MFTFFTYYYFLHFFTLLLTYLLTLFSIYLILHTYLYLYSIHILLPTLSLSLSHCNSYLSILFFLPFLFLLYLSTLCYTTVSILLYLSSLFSPFLSLYCRQGWPSGPRRQFKVLFSSEAWVRTPLLAFSFFFLFFSCILDIYAYLSLIGLLA